MRRLTITRLHSITCSNPTKICGFQAWPYLDVPSPAISIFYPKTRSLVQAQLLLKTNVVKIYSYVDFLRCASSFLPYVLFVPFITLFLVVYCYVA